MKCKKCETQNEEKFIFDDDEYCISCYEKIRNSRNNIMKNAIAARFFINNVKGANTAKLEMAAFLDIFHPELSNNKKNNLIRNAT